MSTTRAKFVCHIVTKSIGTDKVSMTPVISGSEENKSFSMYTPSGSLELTITNPELIGKFAPGEEFYLDITKVDAGE